MVLTDDAQLHRQIRAERRRMSQFAMDWRHFLLRALNHCSVAPGPEPTGVFETRWIVEDATTALRVLSSESLAAFAMRREPSARCGQRVPLDSACPPGRRDTAKG